MIIGNGLVATALKQSLQENQGFLFFASGVSNSNETRLSEFEREKKLLLETLQTYQNKIFIYFSSCDITNAEHVEYFSHKSAMENIVKSTAKNYYIFRLPQVVGKTSNTNTLINFLYWKIQNNSRFVLWANARRNLIDIDDVVSIIKYIISENFSMCSTINIAAPIDYSIIEIVSSIEKHLKRKGFYTLVDKGNYSKIDTTHLIHVFSELKIIFNQDYLDILLRKYYS